MPSRDSYAAGDYRPVLNPGIIKLNKNAIVVCLAREGGFTDSVPGASFSDVVASSFRSCKEKVGDLEGLGFGGEVGAVTEDDDGEAGDRIGGADFAGEADDVGMEALGFAVVPHA